MKLHKVLNTVNVWFVYIIISCHIIEFSSGNSTISVKGKGLTNIEIYVERKVFSKSKIYLEHHQVSSASSTTGLALIFLLMHYF